jgi:hypothetical protein
MNIDVYNFEFLLDKLIEVGITKSIQNGMCIVTERRVHEIFWNILNCLVV